MAVSGILFFLLILIQVLAKIYKLNILERFEHYQKEGS